jgi:hypothetical protein
MNDEIKKKVQIATPDDVRKSFEYIQECVSVFDSIQDSADMISECCDIKRASQYIHGVSSLIRRISCEMKFRALEISHLPLRFIRESEANEKSNE